MDWFSILYDVYKYNKNIKEEYKQNMNKYGQELSDFKKNYNWIVRQYQEEERHWNSKDNT